MNTPNLFSQYFRIPGSPDTSQLGAKPNILAAIQISNTPAGRAWWAEYQSRLPPSFADRGRQGGIRLFLENTLNLGSGWWLAADVRVKIEDTGFCFNADDPAFEILCNDPPAPWPDWLAPKTRYFFHRHLS